ncbi:MAG TPA: DUF1080 domain-containing protein [Gemmataceae bacterium]|nr:DUF1080 domain-containing protein [Gemmataceae bacterium]
MCLTLLRRCLPLLVLVAVLAWLGGASAADDDKDFKPLFNGKDLSGFKFELAKKDADPMKTFSVKDGVIVVSGTPNGYFYTDKSYKNYILRFDFRYPKAPGNSGYLIHITGEHKVWPKCIEVQGQYQNVCAIFPIGGLKGPRPPVDKEARDKVRKPANEWNSVEIISKDGTLTSKLNGVVICASEPYEVKEGPIGFQSEGAEIHFRNIRIKELK